MKMDSWIKCFLTIFDFHLILALMLENFKNVLNQLWMSCWKADLALWVMYILDITPTHFWSLSSFWKVQGKSTKDDLCCARRLSICISRIVHVCGVVTRWQLWLCVESFEILCHWPPTTGSAATELSNIRSYLLSLHIQLNGLWLLFISVWGKKCVSHSVRV